MGDDPFFPFFIGTMLKKNGPFLLNGLKDVKCEQIFSVLYVCVKLNVLP